jgi:hypothetical protein
MRPEILKAYQVLARSATVDDIRDACRQLFLESDLFKCARTPYEPSEVEEVTDAIFEYIQYIDDDATKELFIPLPGNGKKCAIETHEFASQSSSDLLLQNLSWKFASLDQESLRSHLKRFFVAIIFRYRFCASQDLAAFRVSILLEYIEAVRILLKIENREQDHAESLLETLQAMASVEHP